MKVRNAKPSNVIDTLNLHIRENVNTLCKAFKFSIFMYTLQKKNERYALNLSVKLVFVCWRIYATEEILMENEINV